MKILKARRGPFAEQPFFSQADIDGLCFDELSTVGLLPKDPSPIRIDRFIEKRFGRAHTYEVLPDGVLGLTRFGAKGVQDIVLSESLEDERTKPAERRLRTTLAHEAGHGLLHSSLFALDATKPLFGDWSDKQQPKVLCRDEGTRGGYQGDWWEYQANMVMGAILLPRNLFERALAPFMETVGGLGLMRLPDSRRSEAVLAMAETFDVNPVVVRIRLESVSGSKNSGQLSL
jgi:hypothetical protein